MPSTCMANTGLLLMTYIGQGYLACVCHQNKDYTIQGDTNMKIYVGNLSYEVTEQDLRQEFGAFGEVTSANIITDKYSGRPKGFGFVEMATKSEGEAAITGLNGKSNKGADYCG